VFRNNSWLLEAGQTFGALRRSRSTTTASLASGLEQHLDVLQRPLPARVALKAEHSALDDIHHRLIDQPDQSKVEHSRQLHRVAIPRSLTGQP
jgi:hypothetical protein